MLKNGLWVECKNCKYFDRMNSVVGHCIKRDVVLNEDDGCASWESALSGSADIPKRKKSTLDLKNRDGKYAERQMADSIKLFAKVEV